MTDNSDDKFAYHQYISAVQAMDLAELLVKDKSYGASWKKRGGVGAFMMFARVWDRLEEIVTKHGAWGGGDKDAMPYDVFSWVTAENRGWKYGDAQSLAHVGRDGTVLACIRDLRRYLTLAEAEMMQRRSIPVPASHKIPD